MSMTPESVYAEMCRVIGFDPSQQKDQLGRRTVMAFVMGYVIDWPVPKNGVCKAMGLQPQTVYMSKHRMRLANHGRMAAFLVQHLKSLGVPMKPIPEPVASLIEQSPMAKVDKVAVATLTHRHAVIKERASILQFITQAVGRKDIAVRIMDELPYSYLEAV
jgi:hypothetical protein